MLYFILSMKIQYFETEWQENDENKKQ